MTTTRDLRTAPARPDAAAGARPNDRLLRTTLRVNAANAAICGALLAAFADRFGDWLGTGHPGWIRAVGLGLVGFAGFVSWISFGSVGRLRRETPGVIVGDAVWVAASVVTLVLGWFEGVGIPLVIAMAVAVDLFATLQFVGWRRLRPA